MKTLQKFASVHANIHHHFCLEGHLVDRQTYKERRSAALAEWQTFGLGCRPERPRCIVSKTIRTGLRAPREESKTTRRLGWKGLRGNALSSCNVPQGSRRLRVRTH
jgi:hypothetical protein